MADLGPYGAFMQGFNDREAYLDRSRLANMQAFNEFRRLNPYATVADLQMAVDQIYGGQNLLYSVPSTERLQAIADLNAKAKAQYDMEQKVNLATKQANLQSTLMDTASKMATMYGDPASAATAFYELYGNDPNIKRQFTPDMFGGLQARAQTDFIRSNLDTAISLLDSGNSDLKQFFPGINPAHIGALQSAAEGKRKERDENKALELENREMQRMATMSQIGGDFVPSTSLPEAVQKRLRDQWSTHVTNKRADVLAGVSDNMRQQPEILTRLLSGDEAGVRELVRQQMKLRVGAYGQPTDQEVQMVVDQLKTGAMKLQSDQRKQLLTDTDKRVDDIFTKQMDAGRDQALATIANADSRKKVFGSGVAGEVAAATVQSLVKDQKYNLTGDDIVKIGDYLRNDPRARKILEAEPIPSDATIRRALMAAPEITARLQSADPAKALDTARSTARRAAGLFDIAKADDFVRTQMAQINSDATTGREQVRAQVDKILAAQLDPDQKLAQIQSMAQKVATAAQGYQAELASRLKSATMWSDPTGRPFTQADVEQLSSAYSASAKQILEVLSGAEAAVKTQLSNRPKYDMSGNVVGGAPPAAAAPAQAAPPPQPQGAPAAPARIIQGPRGPVRVPATPAAPAAPQVQLPPGVPDSPEVRQWLQILNDPSAPAPMKERARQLLSQIR